jgi:hypothetical protein
MPTKISILFPLILVFIGCGRSDFLTMSESRRVDIRPDELEQIEFHLAVGLDFVSLKKGEIVGEDFFKYEKRKTFRIDSETPGTLAASGPDWLTVAFNDGILLTFRPDPADGEYKTPGWGTLTIQDERFDVKQGVLTGRYVNLLFRPRQ